MSCSITKPKCRRPQGARERSRPIQRERASCVACEVAGLLLCLVWDDKCPIATSHIKTPSDKWMDKRYNLYSNIIQETDCSPSPPQSLQPHCERTVQFSKSHYSAQQCGRKGLEWPRKLDGLECPRGMAADAWTLAPKLSSLTSVWTLAKGWSQTLGSLQYS